MKLTAGFGGTLAVLCMLAAPAASQDELVLKDHHLLRGKVVSSTADSVVFEHVVGETSDKQTYAAADLDPHSFYIIRTHAIGDDAAAHVELGKYCMAHGLHTRGRNQFHEAQKLDPSLKEGLKPMLAKGHEGSAGQLLAKADALQKKGDVAGALREATDVIRLFPDTPSADKARKFVKTAHAQLSQQRTVKEAAADASEADKALVGIKKEIQRAADLNNKGLQAKEQSQSLNAFKQSTEIYKKALHDLKQAKQSPDVVAATKQATDALVGVYINEGSIYMTRTDFNSALGDANQALAIAPDSGTAKSFRARVASASADSDIGGYIIRR